MDKSGRTIVIVAGPVRMGRVGCFADQERFLNRQLSLPVSMMSPSMVPISLDGCVACSEYYVELVHALPPTKHLPGTANST